MDHVELGILLDFYGPLLTKRQLCIMDQTVNEALYPKLRSAKGYPARE